MGEAEDKLRELGFTIGEWDGDPEARHLLGCGCIADGTGATVIPCGKCSAYHDERRSDLVHVARQPQVDAVKVLPPLCSWLDPEGNQCARRGDRSLEVHEWEGDDVPSRFWYRVPLCRMHVKQRMWPTDWLPSRL